MPEPKLDALALKQAKTFCLSLTFVFGGPETGAAGADLSDYRFMQALQRDDFGMDAHTRRALTASLYVSSCRACCHELIFLSAGLEE